MARKFCPVGKVLQGVHIVIIGDDGKPLPVGCSGEVSRSSAVTFIGQCGAVSCYRYCFMCFPPHPSNRPDVTIMVDWA